VTTHSYVEYGGLASVPGPFRCSDATIYALALKADKDALQTLCGEVLTDRDRDRDRELGYSPLGEFVILTFGTMDVASMCTDHSTLFGTTYADMGTSREQHVAFWVPTAAGHRKDHTTVIERFAMFVPAMWVDNPVSLVGGREIYGLAKQWGQFDIEPGDEPSCELQVFGGAFGQRQTSGYRRLLEVTPGDKVGTGKIVEEVVIEAGRTVWHGLERLLKGDVAVPDAELVAEAASALHHRQLHQVAARQFREARANGVDATPVELVELVSTFGQVGIKVLNRKFEFTLDAVPSHPIGKVLGVQSQTVDGAVEVTSSFDLAHL